MSTLDWGLGEYEGVAPQLLPAAQAAVELAGLTAGQHVVDVGCGTGNAALLAAEQAGVRVTGVDPAPRLLEVARAAAAQRGLDVTFVRGDAASLPLPDGDADVVMSVFAVIFAADPVAAAAELARVAAPEGKIVLTAWIPGGPVLDVMRMLGEAAGRPPGQAFEWHEHDRAAALLQPHGFEVAVHERSLMSRAPTVQAYWQASVLDHPVMAATKPVLEQRGVLAEVLAAGRAILEEGNEVIGGFGVTSRFVVITGVR
ncbi:MAG: class I SAM-dependent methyltransferase [Kibdelosporangium sp.]